MVDAPPPRAFSDAENPLGDGGGRTDFGPIWGIAGFGQWLGPTNHPLHWAFPRSLWLFCRSLLLLFLLFQDHLRALLELFFWEESAPWKSVPGAATSLPAAGVCICRRVEGFCRIPHTALWRGKCTAVSLFIGERLVQFPRGTWRQRCPADARAVFRCWFCGRTFAPDHGQYSICFPPGNSVTFS